MSASESVSKAKMISAPRIIATDSIPASVNVGTEVPTLTSTASSLTNGGVVANTVSDRDTGVTLQIVARVSPSGIVTMIINQEVSTPEQPASNSAIQSPSFSKSTVQTQVTVQDGDTIAIGGIIREDSTFGTGGIPYLNRLPVIGTIFGARTYSKSRSELIIFLTPRVIYDTNQVVEASDELKGSMRTLKKDFQKQ